MGCLGFSLAAGFRPLLFTVVGSSSWHNHANGSGPRLCCDQVSWEWGSGTVCRYGTRPAPRVHAACYPASDGGHWKSTRPQPGAWAWVQYLKNSVNI